MLDWAVVVVIAADVVVLVAMVAVAVAAMEAAVQPVVASLAYSDTQLVVAYSPIVAGSELDAFVLVVVL